MDWLLLAAGAASLLAGAVHIAHGELRFLPPLMESGTVAEKDAVTTAGLLRVAWHVWALAYLAFAAILIRLSLVDSLDESGRFIVVVIAACYAAAALLSVVVLKGRHASWVLWGALATLTYLGQL